MQNVKRGPGRPQAQVPHERRSRILEAAGSLFIRQGFHDTNMEQIAQHCGMSKRTLYQIFDNKDALFEALICDVNLNHSPDQPLAQDATECEYLLDALYHMARWVLSPRQIGLTRLIIAEANISPDLSSKFRNQVFELGRKHIKMYCNINAKNVFFSNTEEMASIVYGATIADLQIRALAGEDINPLLESNLLVDRIKKVIDLIAHQ